MTNQRVSIELPESIFHRFVQMAEATHQPLEDLITQSVVSNLPPSALAITQTQANAIQHENHVQLLEKNQIEDLSAEDQRELTNLRQTADRLMLRRAYAWAILRWKGHRIPPLQELATPL
jgi:hypothetical protein